jgi:hypothetical protein
VDRRNSTWNRQELYERVWRFPLRKLATEYGISARCKNAAAEVASSSLVVPAIFSKHFEGNDSTAGLRNWLRVVIRERCSDFDLSADCFQRLGFTRSQLIVEPANGNPKNIGLVQRRVGPVLVKQLQPNPVGDVAIHS